MYKNIFVAILLCVVSASIAAKKRPTDTERLIAITPDSAFTLIKLDDDELDTIAVISSENVFKAGNEFSMPWSDSFLRAGIQKKSGKLLIMLLQNIDYRGSWRFYNSATYESMDGPVQAKFNLIARNVISCAGGCAYNEKFSFLVDEKVLRDFSSKYQQGQLVVWQYKFNSKFGGDWKDSISVAEVSGFLRALDEYRIKHGLEAQK